MKIIKTGPISYIDIETDEGTQYQRYSDDNWYVWMGESLEPHFNCSEIEALYQQYINEKG